MNDARPVARLAVAGVLALTLLCVLWEAWLAPLRAGGSWLVLKALPLALLVPSTMRARPRALQGLSLLLPFYVAEGIVRGFSESGRHAFVAWCAALLAAATLACVIVWVRRLRNAP